MRKGTEASTAALMGMLGQSLVTAELITEEELESALERKRKEGGFLGEILIEMGLLTPHQIGAVLEEALDVPYVDLAEVPIDPRALEMISEHYQRRNRVVPYQIDGRSIYVAM